MPSVTIEAGVVRVDGCSEDTCVDHGPTIRRIVLAITAARRASYECGWTDGFMAGSAL